MGNACSGVVISIILTLVARITLLWARGKRLAGEHGMAARVEKVGAMLGTAIKISVSLVVNGVGLEALFPPARWRLGGFVAWDGSGERKSCGGRKHEEFGEEHL